MNDAYTNNFRSLYILSSASASTSRTFSDIDSHNIFCIICFSPLRKMVIGGWLASLSFLITGFVQLQVNVRNCSR